MVFQHVKKSRKVENVWYVHASSVTANQKYLHFEVSSSLFLHNNNEQFVHRMLTCNKKWILYNNWQWSAQWLDQEAPTSFPKPNLHQEKVRVTVWWSELIWPTTAFGSQWKHYIWKVSSANWRDAAKAAMPAVGIGLQKRPNSSLWQHSTACCTTNASKVEQIGLRSFVSSATFAWPLANWLPFLQASQQLFAGKMLPQPARGRKCFWRVWQIEAQIFMLQE